MKNNCMLNVLRSRNSKNKFKYLNRLLGLKIPTHYDNRENHSPGWKYNHWEQKGVTLRLEVGPGELKNEEVRVVQRIDNKKY